MKKLILLVCFLLVSSFGYSQILEENFSYADGALLSDNGWVAFSGAGNVPLVVTSPGLTYTDYAGSGIGLATTVINGSGSREDDYKSFTSTQTSGSIYTSMMVNVTAGSLTDDYFAAYLPSTSTTLFNGRLYCKDDGAGNISFGISKTTAGSGGIVYGPATFTTGVTYVLVLKYTFNVGSTTDDVITLYAFDGAIPATEPVTAYAGPVGGTATDLADLDRFALRQTSGTLNIIVDGINTQTTWNNSVLPVELASFTSTVSNRDVTLNWSTASELNNSGFEIERSANNVWTKVGNVAGNGTSSTVNNYSFTDRNLATGSYSYRLKQVDFNGNFEYFNLNNEINIGTPSTYALSQNYPNPFNPTTTINFDLPTDGNVSLKLYDMSGKEVATLVNEVRSAGYYSVNFNASQLTSGVYFYTISADNFTATRKMLLVK
ncbi:MAG: T9SS type A sorting domain-containing protein [Ignavibacteriae bacterium]|nr:T9SS type A sorting domain-containing protein [Ignavibacteriota bacterium]